MSHLYSNAIERLSVFGIIQLLLLVSSLKTCSKLVDEDFPVFEKIPVINGILIGNDTIRLHLSMAQQIDTTAIENINNAQIILLNNGESEQLSPEGKGYYSSYRLAIPGQAYECSVTIDGYGQFHTIDTVPDTCDVRIIHQTNQSRFNEEGIFMEGIEFEFTDNPLTNDFYEVAIYRSENNELEITYPFNENEEILLNEGLEPYTTETVLFSDELIRDSEVQMKLEWSPSDYEVGCVSEDSCFQIINEHSLILELRHVSRSYYTYMKSFYLYQLNRYPYFVEGTASTFSIYSNIEGAYGIWAALSKSVDSIFVDSELIPR